LELHLQEKHRQVVEGEMFHSEVQLKVAGLLGMAMRVNKVRRWKCPFGYCPSQFDHYSEVVEHILKTTIHDENERFLFDQLGGFWAAILGYWIKRKQWPRVSDLFCRDAARVTAELIPLTKEEADQLWKSSDIRVTERELGQRRFMPGSPLEDLIQFLRRRASTQTSTETSDVERRGRHRDQSDEEVSEQDETEADTEVEELKKEIPSEESCQDSSREDSKERREYKNGAQRSSDQCHNHNHNHDHNRNGNHKHKHGHQKKEKEKQKRNQTQNTKKFEETKKKNIKKKRKHSKSETMSTRGSWSE
jgi:flagellar biosynthesis GTPase FlhF